MDFETKDYFLKFTQVSVITLCMSPFKKYS